MASGCCAARSMPWSSCCCDFAGTSRAPGSTEVRRGARRSASRTPEEARRRARLRTLLPILSNVSLAVLVVMAVLMALAALGIQVGPLIAGAGVVRVAVGFGAQTWSRTSSPACSPAQRRVPDRRVHRQRQPQGTVDGSRCARSSSAITAAPCTPCRLGAGRGPEHHSRLGDPQAQHQRHLRDRSSTR